MYDGLGEVSVVDPPVGDFGVLEDLLGLFLTERLSKSVHNLLEVSLADESILL